ncbi:HU domain-containing protein [Cochleicola gelatinilyticus]|uniref:Sporulation protein n=1 Tax=Cochleicola gelatinilyticus TaxID=1763537 RepID=A0A167J072_9FLAO|nr:SPOR domain-containing protein [Cochleicola gelatinilyticus]OAB80191.1 sporulation protein [Cochleicola gelatinilyticus]
MQLATYVNDLLYRYECVIIPGFGAFLTQYRSARIDNDSHTFYPPGKTVSFNKQLQTNDGLLANYIASVENCSYPEALQKIRNFTGTLSHQLLDGKTVTIKNIGDFKLNEEHSVQFTPSEKENFATSSFGLSTFTTPEVLRSATVDSSSSDSKTPILFTPEKREAIPYLKYAAIAVIALSVTSFGGMKLYENGVQKHNFVTKQEADKRVENEIQEATFVIENPLAPLTLTLPKESGSYHIVAGAYRIEANAEKKIRQLAAKGFSAKKIGKNRYGLHQVVYNSYEDRREALRDLRTIKRTENKDAWLLVQNLSK